MPKSTGTPLWYRDQFRVYLEFLYADGGGQDLSTLPIDVNRSDVLNLFVDVKAGDVDGRPVYIRAGRQELLYVSERLIPPLDWANTRRTHQGVKTFDQGDAIDVARSGCSRSRWSSLSGPATRIHRSCSSCITRIVGEPAGVPASV